MRKDRCHDTGDNMEEVKYNRDTHSDKTYITMQETTNDREERCDKTDVTVNETLQDKREVTTEDKAKPDSDP